MPKRKYSRKNDPVNGWKCTNKKCGWEGVERDQIQVEPSVHIMVCPVCMNDEFYGLIEKPKTNH